jgi:hypothetical protein
MVRMGTVEIELDPQSRDVLERFTDSVDRFVRTIREDVTGAFDAANSTPLPDDTIVEWPERMKAPRVISTCPTCHKAVEDRLATWESLVSPNGLVGVSGFMRHMHDDGGATTWAVKFDAAEIPPTRDDAADPAADAAAEIAEDVQQGQEYDGEEPFEFVPDSDGTITLRNAIFQALGAASVCWDDMYQTGEFDSATALKIGEALTDFAENALTARLAQSEAEIERLVDMIGKARAIVAKEHGGLEDILAVRRALGLFESRSVRRGAQR